MGFKSEFEQALEQIKSHILDYLSEKGYDINKPILCINPEHNDKTPSLLCADAERKGWTIHCRGCGITYDIFNVYSILEKTPQRGPDWINKVVKPLATKYGIVLPKKELTEDEQFSLDLRSLYEEVSSLLEHDIEKMGTFPREYISSRGWKKETLESLDIGTLSYEKLSTYFSEDTRKKFGLNHPEVFNDEALIFTIRDRFGRAIRFFARVDKKEQKYTSTPTRSLQVDLYAEEGILYLSHLITRKNSRAVIVEGQGDAVTAYQEGIENCVALCGSGGFHEEHEETLGLKGISSVVILFDGDDAGRKATQKILTSDQVKDSSVEYSTISLPDDEDPDSFIRKNGVDALKDLLKTSRLSAFEFILTIEETDNPESLCEKLVPYITASRSEVSREKMANQLSEFLMGQVSTGAILADVRRLDREKDTDFAKRQRSIAQAAAKTIERHPENAKEALSAALQEIDEIERETVPIATVQQKALSRLNSCKIKEEKGELGSYILSPHKFGNLLDLLKGGSWVEKRVFIIGAVENMGKSSYLDALLVDILRTPENNAMVYLLSIDDAAEDRYRRMVCNILDDITFTQSMIINPEFNIKLGIPDIYERREFGYSILREMITSGDLLIEDERDGKTLSYLESRVAQIRRENPKKRLIIGLDNLHDCADFSKLDAKERMTRIIKQVKGIAKNYNALFIATAEYRKNDPSMPGTNEDLSDSKSLKYAPHLILHLFSDLGFKDENDAVLFHKTDFGDIPGLRGKLFPRLKIIPGKNKVTDRKGKQNSIFTDFFPASSLFRAVKTDAAIRQIQQREMELSERRRG